MTLSDETGFLNIVVPPQVYRWDRAAVRGEALVWMGGAVMHRGVVALHAAWVRPLSQLVRNPRRSDIPWG